MLKKDRANTGPTVEARDESDHAAKVARAKEIIARTYHDPTAVHWQSDEDKAWAFRQSGQKKVSDCVSCNITAIDYLRTLAGLHSIKTEAPPPIYKQRLDVCRGNTRKGIPQCEHLAFTNMNCGLCLCFVDVKARMKSMKCPINKWPK